MLDDKIKHISETFNSDIQQIDNLKDLEDFRIKYFSRNGLIASLFDELKNVPNDQKPSLGKSLNLFRNKALGDFSSIKGNLESVSADQEQEVDISLPGNIKQIGSRHILTQTLDEIKSIFKGLGFSVANGPELESDYYNFESLNFLLIILHEICRIPFLLVKIFF